MTSTTTSRAWPLIRYAARRIGVSIGMLALVSLLIFIALRVIPGDPTTSIAGNLGVTDEQLAAARRELRLDDSILVQYLAWAGGVLRGDLGTSYFSGFSTTALIGDRLGPTIELCLASLVVALLIAVPLAIVSALRPYSVVDKILGAASSAGMSMPVFLPGIALIWVLSVQLGWLPARGYVSLFENPAENLQRLLMPSVTLGLALAAPIMRFLRASLLETLGSDYIRTAEGKGMAWRKVILRHALPNAVLPSLNFVGLMVGTLLGGVVVIEWIYGWPGLGSMAVDAVTKRDYIVLQGIVLVAAALFLLATFIVDVVSNAIDPRLRGAW